MENDMQEDTPSGRVHCELESAFDLAALLNALTLREKEQKEQRAYCEASARGLKFVAQSAGKDATVLGWMFDNAFKEYSFTGNVEEINFKLPIAPLLSCLQIFTERAALTFSYPEGSSNDLHFVLKEDGATTECRLRTLTLGEGPSHVSFLGNGDDVRNFSVFRPARPDAWHLALSEFEGLDAPDVVLRVTLRAAPALDIGLSQQLSQRKTAPAIVLRAQTITSDAEVEIPHDSLDEFQLAPEGAASGEISNQYLLSSVLASCLRAAKEAKAVKVRFNRAGVMSVQFILRSRGQRDQLFCEALVCPLAESLGMGVYGSTSYGGTYGATQPVGASM